MRCVSLRDGDNPATWWVGHAMIQPSLTRRVDGVAPIRGLKSTAKFIRRYATTGGVGYPCHGAETRGRGPSETRGSLIVGCNRIFAA